jgi:pSer/pThr/pTyr-binding forkhead associated (FHA) protein
MHGPTEGAPSLQIVAGRGTGTFIPIGDEPFVIGRAEEGAGSLFDDPELSRRHALVSRTSDGGLVVADLDSTNGTYVNGNRLTGPAPVTPGDAVWVGSTTLQVVDLAGEPGMKRVARIARMPGGVQRIPDEIVRILDQRAPVPFKWVAQVAAFGVVIALGLNFALLTLSTHALDVQAEGPLSPVRVGIETIIICFANSCGFFANFHRRTTYSMVRYLLPTAIVPTVLTTISVISLHEHDALSVLTAMVMVVLPLSIIVPRLLSLPSRARALPPPPASELGAGSTEKEASVG